MPITMKQSAYVVSGLCGTSARPIQCPTRITRFTRRPQTTLKRSARFVSCAQGSTQPEPVEDGVTLPKPKDQAALNEQSKWLETELTSWLNAEWEQTEPQVIHDEIGKRTGMIYARQRMEGEDDLSSVMLAIGSELEGMDFSRAFVGPWNVANRAAELLLEYCAGERIQWKPFAGLEGATRAGNGTVVQEDIAVVITSRKQAVSPSLGDAFERLKFLRDVLDGSASQELVSGAVAVAVGFRYDPSRGLWDGSEVEDEHFRSFGDRPPNVLGDENAADMTDTLAYLEQQLGFEDDESGTLAENLHVVVETLHGADLTKVQMEDEDDHAFRKRVTVAKWLHLLGGF